MFLSSSMVHAQSNLEQFGHQQCNLTFLSIQHFHGFQEWFNFRSIWALKGNFCGRSIRRPLTNYILCQPVMHQRKCHRDLKEFPDFNLMFSRIHVYLSGSTVCIWNFRDWSFIVGSGTRSKIRVCGNHKGCEEVFMNSKKHNNLCRVVHSVH